MLLRSLVCVAALLFSLPVKAETISLVADSWCPFNCSPTSSQPGYMVEIAQRAFKKHGIDVTYSTLPWARAIEDTRAGKYSAIVAASREDGQGFVFPNLTLGKMRNAFFVKKGNPWRYAGIESLSSVSLGVVADYSYQEALDKYISTHTKSMKHIQAIAGDNALETNLKKLLAGRIGALVEERSVMAYHLANLHEKAIVDLAGTLEPSSTDELFIAFSPNNPKSKHYAKLLSDEVAAMRKSGELAAILAEYNVQDWAE